MTQATNPETPIKSYSKKELCELYGITAPTLQAWYKRANLIYNKRIRILWPIEVAQLFKAIGHP